MYVYASNVNICISIYLFISIYTYMHICIYNIGIYYI